MEDARPLKQLCFSCIEKRGQSLIEQTRLELEQQQQEREEGKRPATQRVAVPPAEAEAEAADGEPPSGCRRQTITSNQLLIDCANSNSKRQRQSKNCAGEESKDQDDALRAAQSMAAVAARLIKAAHSSSRPTLRQIDIVGQLNHSARQGFLLVMTNPLVALLSSLMLLTIVLNGSPSNTAEASVWPFQPAGGWNGSNSGASGRPTSWPSVSGKSSPAQHAGNTTSRSSGKRVARMSADQHAAGPGQQQQPASAGAVLVPPPVSQQFHYFWNHDQIEPRIVATEAQRILAEAQAQTDRNHISVAPGAPHYEGPQRTRSIADELRRASSDSGAHEPKETITASSSSPVSDYQQQLQSIVIPADIQRQLTALVLQMQRQQQMSMATQPRFDQTTYQGRMRNPPLGRRLGGDAGSSLASPFASWMQMAVSGEHPSVLSGLHSPVGISPRVSPPPTAATMAGVPVFGPFLVAPSPFQMGAASRAALFQHDPNQLGHHLRQQVPSARSAAGLSSPTHKPSGSLLGQTGRKLWPLFGGYFGGSGGFSSEQAGRSSPGGSLFAAASSSRSTIVPPPPQGDSPSGIADLSVLPPESMALLDIASSQLVNAIAGQMQVRAAQQRLAAALSQAMETRPDFMQAAASSSSGVISDKVVAPLAGAGTTTNLMPPYLMSPVAGYSATPSGPAARAMAMNHLAVATQPSSPTLQALQTLDMLNSIMSGGGGNASATALNQQQQQQYLMDPVPFGHRLKRRHLNTLAPYASDRKLAKQARQPHPAGSGSPLVSAHKTMAGQAKPTKPVPSTQAATVRIVKKDSANVSRGLRGNSVESRGYTEADHDNQSSRSEAGKRRTGHSGNDMFVSEESQQQVRRLKRSALWFTSSESMTKGGHSKEWKSMDPVRLTSQRELLRRQAEISSSYSSAPTAAPKAEQTQAKVQPTSESDALAPAATGGGTGSKGGERQEKSLKIKRIIASASVLHHPVSAQKHSSSQQLQDSSAFRRGTVISGTPIQWNLIQQSSTSQRQDDATEAASKEAALDPMTLALAESTRVANYFQNVDSEKPSPPQAGSAGAKLEQPRQQASPASQQSAPKINLAFSAPSKLVETSPTDGEVRRVNSAPAATGNGARGPLVADSQQQQQQKQRFQAGSLHRHQSQRHLATSQRGASPVAASSGDISSVATGHGAYAMAAASGNANAGSSLSSTTVVAPPQQPSNSQQQQQQQQQGSSMKSAAAQQSLQSGPIAGQSATNMANYARSNSPAPTMPTNIQPPSSTVSYLPSFEPSSSGANKQQPHQLSVGRGLRDNAVQATSFNRHSVVAPSGKQQSGHSAASFERNTSADQSNNYNDEIPPSMPMQNSGSYQDQSSGQQQMTPSNESSGMLMNSADSQNSLLDSQQQSAMVYNSMEQAQAVSAAQNEQHPTVDPISGQSMMNLPADGYGQRNNQPQQRAPQHNLDGGMMQDQQAGAFQSSSNQQQQQQLNNFAQSDPSFFGSNQSVASAGGSEGSFFNAPDVTMPSTDTSSLYSGGLTQPPSFQQPTLQQQQQQQLTDNTMQQYMSMPNNNNNKPALMSLPNQQQQQLFSQQMRALGQAVSNFNQQRLISQQLQAASYNPSTRTFFPPQEPAHQTQDHLYQPAHHYPSAYQQGSIDEEAAAGTLAAQGIATLPSAAQFMAMQNANQLAFGAAAELAAAGSGSMLMAELAKRERADDDGGNRLPKNKKSKRQSGPKQVSHHYHFNSLGSPFEDPNNEFNGLNPLEIAGSVQGNENGYVGRPVRQNKVKVKDEEEEEKSEEEKSKKRGGLLRRFSLKNLFKRFRKDKKKENENNEEDDGKGSGNSNNDNESGSNNNDNSQDASSDRG